MESGNRPDESRRSGQVGAFYDQYVDRQVAVGVNDRHRAILEWLQRFGLRPQHRVLEIGCGIGTVTQLILEQLDAGGSILAVDLSPESIAVARMRLGGYPNADLIAGDILEVDIPETFDVVVLPDVIEHIPLDAHPALFGRVASWLAPGGFALLHYPNPHHLEWSRKQRPDLLQIIDQSIHVDRLAADAYPHGLYLDYLQTYSIWERPGDYVVAVLRPNPASWDPTPVPQPRRSIFVRVAARVRALSRSTRDNRSPPRLMAEGTRYRSLASRESYGILPGSFASGSGQATRIRGTGMPCPFWDGYGRGACRTGIPGERA